MASIAAVSATVAAQPALNVPEDVQRTLDFAIVAVPVSFMADRQAKTINSGVGRWYAVAAEVAGIRADAKIPTVIYLHSCTGFGGAEAGHIWSLVDRGYAVIAPNSFARRHRPEGCDPDSREFGLFPDAMLFRMEEARSAYRLASSFSWVDKENIFMMGFSEGGAATARYGNGGLAARVVIGWNCLPFARQSRWLPYVGIDGPLDESIIAVLGGNDPWFQNQELSGDCRPFLEERGSSLSIVVPGLGHNVMGDVAVSELVFSFLHRNAR